MIDSVRRALAAGAIVVAVGACSSGAAAPSQVPPTATTAASAAASAGPSALARVDSPEAAVAAVVAAEPRFAGIQPLNPELIGQCCFSKVQATDTGYTVTIEVGWGDCPSGCIDRHRWSFAVDRSGTVTLIGEQGAVVPSGVPGYSPGPAD